VKRCTACRESKALSLFHTRRASPDGKKQICKQCANAQQKGRRDKRRPEYRTQCIDCSASLHSRKAGAERCQDCARHRDATQKSTWQEQHPENSKRYYARNRAVVISRTKQRRIAQPGYKPRSRMPRELARASKRKARRKWAAANKDRVRENERRSANRRRARLRDSCSPGVTREQWAERLRLFGGFCAYCPRPATTVDHCIPIARGGPDAIDNVVPACRSCNSSKGARLPLEWTPPPLDDVSNHGRPAPI